MARDPPRCWSSCGRLARLCRPAAQREFPAGNSKAFAGTKPKPGTWRSISERLKRERLAVFQRRPASRTSRCRVCCRACSPGTAPLRRAHRGAQGRRGLPPRRPLLRHHRQRREPRADSYSTCTARPKKRGGRWMDECMGRIDLAGAQRAADRLPRLQLSRHPIGATGIAADALRSADDVPTSFGHGLHHMLTRVDFPSVAGINGVPWDAVELPSSSWRTFAWPRRSAATPSRGTSRPANRCAPTRCASCRQRARSRPACSRPAQLEFALFDSGLHSRVLAGNVGSRLMQTLAEVRDEVAVAASASAFNPLPAQLPAHLLGRVCRRLLQYKWPEVCRPMLGAFLQESGIFEAATARAVPRFDPGTLVQPRCDLEAFVEFPGSPSPSSSRC